MDFFSDITNLILLTLALLAGGLLAWPALTRRHHALTPTETTQLINRRNALVIDIRTKEDYSLGHLPQAKHIALDTLADKAETLSRNKAVPIIVVCQTGTRAERACSTLKKVGYSEVFSLAGGIVTWQKENLPLIK